VFKPQSITSLAAGCKYAVFTLPHMKVATVKEGSQEGYCGEVSIELAEPKC
jgi:hypothetical protein